MPRQPSKFLDNEAAEKVAKVKRSISMNPYLIKRAEKLVQLNKFSSFLDIVSTALAEFLTKYEEDLKENKSELTEIVENFLKSDEGQKLISESIRKNRRLSEKEILEKRLAGQNLIGINSPSG